MKERTMIRVLIAAVCVWIGLMLVTGDFAFTTAWAAGLLVAGAVGLPIYRAIRRYREVA